jgi:F-type H+-transporting ATPase subunit b
MELVSPGLGLIFWMTLVFVLLLVILKVFAWKPMLKSLKNREESIHEALHAADKAREEMKEMQFSNEQLLKEAKNERDAILNEARKVKESIIDEARSKAHDEAERIIASAREAIQNEKMAALIDIKNQLAETAINLARGIMQRELSDATKHEEYIRQLIDEIKFN